VLALLRQLNESGKTIVIVTHDPVVAAACHRVIDLSQNSWNEGAISRKSLC